MRVKRKKIAYVAGLGKDDDVIFTIKKNKEIVVSCVKRYMNTIYKLNQLSPATRLMLEYFTEVMDFEDNSLERFTFLFDRYNEFLKKICGETISKPTFKKGIVELKQTGFLLSFGGRGRYFVNPRHYWKSKEEFRERYLKKLFETAHKNEYPNSNLRQALGIKVEEPPTTT